MKTNRVIKKFFLKYSLYRASLKTLSLLRGSEATEAIFQLKRKKRDCPEGIPLGQ